MLDLTPLMFLTPYFVFVGLVLAIPASLTPPEEAEASSIRGLLGLV